MKFPANKLNQFTHTGKYTIRTEQRHWISLAFSALSVPASEIHQTDKIDFLLWNNLSFKQYEDSSVLAVYFCILGSMLNTQQLSALWHVLLGGQVGQCKKKLKKNTLRFIQPLLWCTGSDVTYWAWRQMDLIMQWGGGNTSWGLLFTACPRASTHTHTHILPVGSPSLRVDPQQFTRPLYVLHAAQMVSLWFIWQPATSQDHAAL